jgi:hypothetical protein
MAPSGEACFFPEPRGTGRGETDIVVAERLRVEMHSAADSLREALPRACALSERRRTKAATTATTERRQ